MLNNNLYFMKKDIVIKMNVIAQFAKKSPYLNIEIKL